MSFTTYYPTGQPYIVEERVNGIRKGIVVIYNDTGQIISIIKYNNIQVCYILYCQNGIQHNLHGPALISWYHNIQVCYISYWQNGIQHNLHGPNFIGWYHNLQVCYISYWQNGIRHNLHGPAIMSWGINGIIYRINFYHFGKLIKEYKF